jgi:hypothetical protein
VHKNREQHTTAATVQCPTAFAPKQQQQQTNQHQQHQNNNSSNSNNISSNSNNKLVRTKTVLQKKESSELR